MDKFQKIIVGNGYLNIQITEEILKNPIIEVHNWMILAIPYYLRMMRMEML